MGRPCQCRGLGTKDAAAHPMSAARLANPMGVGHLAIAIQVELARPDRARVAAMPARQDGGYAGADRPLAHLQRAIALDDRGEPDFDAGDVGNGIARPGSSVERNTDVTGPRFCCGSGHVLLHSTASRIKTECRDDQRGEHKQGRDGADPGLKAAAYL